MLRQVFARVNAYNHVCSCSWYAHPTPGHTNSRREHRFTLHGCCWCCILPRYSTLGSRIFAKPHICVIVPGGSICPTLPSSVQYGFIAESILHESEVPSITLRRSLRSQDVLDGRVSASVLVPSSFELSRGKNGFLRNNFLPLRSDTNWHVTVLQDLQLICLRCYLLFTRLFSV